MTYTMFLVNRIDIFLTLTVIVFIISAVLTLITLFEFEIKWARNFFIVTGICGLILFFVPWSFELKQMISQ